MRLTLIVNPFASAVTHRTRVVIQKAVAELHELTVIETTKSGHAIRLAHGAGRAGAEVVIALGGDGTINEVANGLLGTDTAVVGLPGGSTNVFARALGYPNEPLAATTVMLEALASKSIVSAGVGMANDRAFLFNVGAGFDAAVVGQVEQRGPLKRYLGHPLFVSSTFETWLRRVDRRVPWFSITTDDGRTVEDAQLAITLNCNPYTYLGSRPLILAPAATLDTPLSIVALTSLSLRHMVPAVLTALRRSSGFTDGPTTRRLDDVTGATLLGRRPFPFQVDGEYLGPVDTLRLTHRPNALRLVVPRAAQAIGTPDVPT